MTKKELTMEMLDKAAGGNQVFYPEQEGATPAEIRASWGPNRWVREVPEVSPQGYVIERIEDIDKYQIKKVSDPGL